MKSIPKHFSLVKEHTHSYEIHDSRDKTNFHVAKSALDLGMHAKLSKIQRFDEGGEAQPEESQPPVTINVNAAEPEPERSPSSLLDVQRAQAGVSAPAPTLAPAPTTLLDAQRAQAGVQPAIIPVAPKVASPQAPVTAKPTAIPTVPVAPGGSYLSQARRAQALSEQGIRAQHQADADIADRDAKTIEDHNLAMQKAVEAFQKQREALDTQHADLTKSVMDQKIDPNHWFTEKSVPGKISTAIGVILGGIGAGLQHSNTNQALQVIQDQIKNDIDAQKANLGKKQTLLSMNLERYRNMDAAMQATMTQMQAMVQGQLQLNAAKSGSAKAKANADYATGVLRAEYLKTLPTLALQDLKISQLHQMQGTAPAPNAISHMMGTVESDPAAQNEPTDIGPSKADLLREQNLLSGKRIPMDPYRYGSGVNQNKLTAMKVAGLLDKESGHKATEEYGKYTKLQHELQEADSVFNIAARNATLRGRISRRLSPHEIEGGGSSIVGDVIKPIAYGLKGLATLGDEHTKQYNAVVEPFVDKLAKDVTGRSTPISIEKLANLMPEQGDDPTTLAVKRAKLFDTLKSSYSFPTLQEHGLVHPSDPIVHLNSPRD